MSDTPSSRWSLEPYCIGMKLRALRTRKRLTLARLAAETGLSTALLSKLETDRMIPTLPTLASIAHVYGVGLGHFFTEPTVHSLSITRKADLEGKSRQGDAARRTPLQPASAARALEAELIELPSESATFVPGHVGVFAVVYVVEGKLVIDCGGLKETLNTGDCACIDSEMPMTWSAAGKDRCLLLSVAPRAAKAE